MGIKTILIISFILFALIELYCFMLQRVSLEIGREYHLDKKHQTDLDVILWPSWFYLTYLIKTIKWIIIGITFSKLYLWTGIIFLTIPLVISAIVPIPYAHFLKIFEKKLHKQEKNINKEKFEHIYNILACIRKKYKIT